MKNQFRFCCEDMEQNVEESHVITYSEIFDEYGLPVIEDGVSYILMKYCPWCGKELPPSRRYEWFEQLEGMGFDNPLFRDDIPPDYKSARWRIK